MKEEESLYDLIKLSTLGSELTYAVSLMRELGRKKQLNGDDNEAALKLPLNAAEFQRIISNNPNLTAIFKGQNEDAELQFSAIDQIKERNMTTSDAIQSKPDMTKTLKASIRFTKEEIGGAMEEDIIQGSEVVYFNDQHDKGYREQTQMVYGISVDKIEKRVNVIFRGSRTPADWAANKKFNGMTVQNPVKFLDEFANDSSLPDDVCIHQGFWVYLLEPGNSMDIFEQVLPILQKNPGYSLFVTGHSLGGALASLFAFRCACRKDIPKPVRCITHAQPLVGDFRLLQSVRKLEKSNNLILLRTRNCEDGVPAVPAFSLGEPKFTYTHIGMELKMYDDNRSKNIKLSKSEKKVKNFALNCKALIKLFVIKAGQDKQKRAHSRREHIRRLEKYEKEIRSLGDKLEDVVSTKNPVIL